MLKRIHVNVLAGSLLLAASIATGPGLASASSPDVAGAAASKANPARAAIARAARLTTSAKQVEEGDRLTLTATIKSPRKASKVMLQKYEPPLYSGDKADWNIVKTVWVRGKRKVNFKVVAASLNSERYRARVVYQTSKPITSKPVAVTVWRWVPLSDYDPYYETGETIFGTTVLNGHPYTGWGAATYSHIGAWESRFTPGRHCKTFRGVLGIADISHDGSSAFMRLTAEETVVYESPVLRPGMDVPVNVPLPQPYRFGIQLFDTTPGGTPRRDLIEAWPVIGDPAFLCTGV